jgi:hypothetical protein
MTIATICHVAQVRLLLVPTAVTGHMTSDDRCYCGARGTRGVSTSSHTSDRLSDISGSLLLPPIVVTGYVTSDGRCYYWAHVTRAVATSPHSNDGLGVCCYWTASSDGLSSVILSLLDCAVAMA